MVAVAPVTPVTPVQFQLESSIVAAVAPVQFQVESSLHHLFQQNLQCAEILAVIDEHVVAPSMCSAHPEMILALIDGVSNSSGLLGSMSIYQVLLFVVVLTVVLPDLDRRVHALLVLETLVRSCDLRQSVHHFPWTNGAVGREV